MASKTLTTLISPSAVHPGIVHASGRANVLELRCVCDFIGTLQPVEGDTFLCSICGKEYTRHVVTHPAHGRNFFASNRFTLIRVRAAEIDLECWVQAWIGPDVDVSISWGRVSAQM